MSGRSLNGSYLPNLGFVCVLSAGHQGNLPDPLPEPLEFDI